MISWKRYCSGSLGMVGAASPLFAYSVRAVANFAGNPRTFATFFASAASSAFSPRQAEVVNTSETPPALAMAAHVRFFADFAARMASVMSDFFIRVDWGNGRARRRAARNETAGPRRQWARR